jgi:hypothetical protein
MVPRPSLLQLLILLVMTSSITTGHAETYFGGFVGPGYPSPFRSVKGEGSFPVLESSNQLALVHITPVYGLKLGHYFRRYPYLGIEGNMTFAHPHVQGQRMTVIAPDGERAIVPTTGSGAFVWSPSGDVVFRWPRPTAGGRTWEPYVGVGVAITLMTVSQGIMSGTSVAPGLHAVGGVRNYLTERLALFLEAQYTRTHLAFTSVSGTFELPAVTFGLTWHLNRTS